MGRPAITTTWGTRTVPSTTYNRPRYSFSNALCNSAGILLCNSAGEQLITSAVGVETPIIQTTWT